MESKFVNEDRILSGKGGTRKRIFAMPRIVKDHANGKQGYICVPENIYLPKSLIGRRVKIRLELLLDV